MVISRLFGIHSKSVEGLADFAWSRLECLADHRREPAATRRREDGPLRGRPRTDGDHRRA